VRRDGYLELSEKFRLYHNLYEKYRSPGKKEYLYFGVDGGEDVVAEIDISGAYKTENFLKVIYRQDKVFVRLF
jgi:hypothetical protein